MRCSVLAADELKSDADIHPDDNVRQHRPWERGRLLGVLGGENKAGREGHGKGGGGRAQTAREHR